MLGFILLALVLIALILIIYYAFIKPTDKKRRKRSEELYQQSSGNFDASAQESLETLTAIEEPTPEDWFRRGNILEFNLLQGDLRRAQRHIINDILRDYTETLAAIEGPLLNQERTIHPDFMIYRIENFNDRLLNLDEEFGMLDLALNRAAPVARQQSIQERKQIAQTATTRSEAAEKFLDASINFTSDAQNVHDPKVNNDLRRVLNKISAGAIDPAVAIAACKKYIQTEYSMDPLNADKPARALRVLDVISAGHTIGTFSDTEDHIFAAVWARTEHPRNKANEVLMKTAVVDALADSIEDGNIVCINGRTGRVLNSLATLDFDETMSGALTYESYKNQIFEETKQIIASEVQKAKDSPIEMLRSIGESYDGSAAEIDPEMEKEFIGVIKQEIDKNLEQYEGKLTPKELDQIRTECYAAIE